MQRNILSNLLRVHPLLLSHPIKRCQPILRNISNSSVSTQEETSLKLNVDNSAIERLHKILKESQFLRVLVEGGGCSGFQYKFEVDTEIDEEEDLIFEKGGVKVVSDVESVKILNGSTVEYHVDLIRAGFRVVDIPQAEKGCSCGVSFSVKL